MKKIISLVLAMLMTATVFASEANVNIVVLNKPIEQKGYIVEGRTLVPLRGIFEEMGYNVEYDAETKTATISSNITTMTFTAGDSFFMFNGNPKELEVPHQIIDGHFVIPLNGVLNLIAKKAEWDGETKTVSIVTDNHGITVSVGAGIE